jgi:hypothetical protein
MGNVSRTRPHPTTVLPLSPRIQYRNAPALIHAFIECPNCGRIRKPPSETMVLLGGEGPERVHCHFRCERCGSPKALLHLEREILSRH